MVSTRTALFGAMIAALGAGVGGVACDKGGSNAASGGNGGNGGNVDGDGGPRYAAVDAGKLRACYTEAACDALRPGDRCYFPMPHTTDPQGFCAPAEPPCKVTTPYCTPSGKTIAVCRFPSQPWSHPGPCEDAGADAFAH